MLHSKLEKTDTDIRKYTFFSHSGKIPEDEYLTEKDVPYTIAGLRKLVEKRVESSDNRGRGDVNRLYPSKEAYLKTVYDVIFGYVEPGSHDDHGKECDCPSHDKWNGSVAELLEE